MPRVHLILSFSSDAIRGSEGASSYRMIFAWIRRFKSGLINHISKCCQSSMAKGKRMSRPRGRRGNGSKTGSTTTKHEVGIQIVDFFDFTTGSTGNVANYWWDNRQNLFNNNTTGASNLDETFCRIRSLEVYALPRRGIDVQQGLSEFNNAAAMYTVNCQTPGLANGTAGLTAFPPAQATNTQVTNVLPQFDTKWKKVFSCNMQKTFQSSVIRPFTDGFRQCLFSMAILDPTTGEPLDGQGSETVSIRIKVVLHIDQPIAPVQTAKFVVYKNSDVTTPQLDLDGVQLPEIRPSYCQMDLKKVRDCMR
jgi:hypothetical protein